MTRLHLRKLLPVLLAPAALFAAGCGESGITVAKSDPLHEGAVVFNQVCAGCHTFTPAGAEGSASKVNDRENKDGPNFDQRKVQYEGVLFAIRNGGFSSGPMPQNLVVGREAELVACFVATYSGRDAQTTAEPGAAPATGAGQENCKQQFASK